MQWNSLSRSPDLDSFIKASYQKQILIFKHSTRCSISSMVRSRVEAQWPSNTFWTPILVDVIANRQISNVIADIFGVQHESPQLLMIENGQCSHHASHFDIDLTRIQTFSGQNNY
ncbi:MAG: bacillithiol system redox-active protein YtxJ [Saprospiraceae bacterium]|nr:bacillithiol system redox-active protein YtxJ [Saprospiraceae bacterium]